MKYLFLLFSVTFYGQVLHHQMISSQGASIKMSNGFTIMQTIGQQSPVGTSSNSYVFMQGFQQSYWGKYIASNKMDAIEDIKTMTYPMPFVTTINFEFSKPILESINVSVFDVTGRLIYQSTRKANNNILTIDFSALPTSEYLIRLNAPKYNYYTKIIKQ